MEKKKIIDFDDPASFKEIDTMIKKVAVDDDMQKLRMFAIKNVKWIIAALAYFFMSGIIFTVELIIKTPFIKLIMVLGIIGSLILFMIYFYRIIGFFIMLPLDIEITYLKIKLFFVKRNTEKKLAINKKLKETVKILETILSKFKNK